MEPSVGLEGRRDPVANSIKNERSRRHPNLRLPGRSHADSGDHAAGQDRQLTGQAECESGLARL